MFTKLMLCWIVLSAFVAASLTQGVAQEQPGQAPPPPRKIPGITAEDPYPRACVDCHINYVEMKLDTRFSTSMKQWREKADPELVAKVQACAPEGMTLQGKHPEAEGALEDIPASCLECHGKTSQEAPPFAQMIHRIHLTGGEQNHFLTMFQGECTYCHKLDLPSGHWSIPSAPEK